MGNDGIERANAQNSIKRLCRDWLDGFRNRGLRRRGVTAAGWFALLWDDGFQPGQTASMRPGHKTLSIAPVDKAGRVSVPILRAKMA
ncbi:uncharacterized protein UV8b_07866 [Ustilaginoidea virens]|uniref:Uncharacterized protein n=1 Tax=Ustilaginoidea virens TaxID=1159556 RepID=A0A8E5HYB6_USTVR|nr:uncharacterized protein UV8b_07866 [Ustilaginoidea virens]QUC23625.1 hypothetical protein UV8b_07866 [Ustilaginoidea virens]